MDNKPFTSERLSKLKEVAVHSPAKLNIFLQVTGKRDDGYHDLNSLMVPISLADEMKFDITEGSGVTCTVNSDFPYDIPTDDTNLAVKAARLYLEEIGISKKISIHIDKKIPVGAGLGGGSSNGATTLCVLNDALGGGYEGRLSKEGVLELAAELGSDVPFFIDCHASIATGRGEKLDATDFPETNFILINPMVTVSTADVYSSLDLTKTRENNILTYSSTDSNSLNYIVNLLSNDLEMAVLDSYPIIGDLKEALINEGALGSLMSGSGSTVFGVFSGREDAARAYMSLKDKYKDFFICHAVSIGQ